MCNDIFYSIKFYIVEPSKKYFSEVSGNYLQLRVTKKKSQLQQVLGRQVVGTVYVTVLHSPFTYSHLSLYATSNFKFCKNFSLSIHFQPFTLSSPLPPLAQPVSMLVTFVQWLILTQNLVHKNWFTQPHTFLSVLPLLTIYSNLSLNYFTTLRKQVRIQLVSVIVSFHSSSRFIVYHISFHHTLVPLLHSNHCPPPPPPLTFALSVFPLYIFFL